MIKLLREPLAPLVIYSGLVTLCFAAYLYEARDISLVFETLTGMFWSILLIYWIIADTRRRRAESCTDFGFLCVMFFPLSLPWHCLRSRGWRGIFTLTLLVGIWMMPYVVAVVTWNVFYG